MLRLYQCAPGAITRHMITYVQRDGEIGIDGATVGFGYSGHGVGLNNPAKEAMQNIGPIPRREWHVVRWDDHHGDKGPQVAVLAPVGHDAHMRSAFLIHGDNADMNHTASHGCIIASRIIRDKLRASGQTQLTVV